MSVEFFSSSKLVCEVFSSIVLPVVRVLFYGLQ